MIFIKIEDCESSPDEAKSSWSCYDCDIIVYIIEREEPKYFCNYCDKEYSKDELSPDDKLSIAIFGRCLKHEKQEEVDFHDDNS